MIANWKFDLCSKRAKPDFIRILFGFLGIPLHCPVASNIIHCYKKEMIVTLSESSKRLLPIFAADSKGVTLIVDITHETGKSCFEVRNKVLKLHQQKLVFLLSLIKFVIAFGSQERSGLTISSNLLCRRAGGMFKKSIF